MARMYVHKGELLREDQLPVQERPREEFLPVFVPESDDGFESLDGVQDATRLRYLVARLWSALEGVERATGKATDIGELRTLIRLRLGDAGQVARHDGMGIMVR